MIDWRANMVLPCDIGRDNCNKSVTSTGVSGLAHAVIRRIKSL